MKHYRPTKSNKLMFYSWTSINLIMLREKGHKSLHICKIWFTEIPKYSEQ